MNNFCPFLLLFASLFLSACAPSIRLTTPEPMKIDVNMKVEVVQVNKAVAATQNPELTSGVAKARRARMSEIQNLKDNSVIGEGRSGYLEIREIPPTWKGKEDYIKETIDAENNDRQVLYKEDAGQSNPKKDLSDVEREYASTFRERAYSGEWIQRPDGTWVRK